MSNGNSCQAPRNSVNAKDYIKYIFKDFVELSGDRLFGDDQSVIGGLAFLNDMPVTVIGQLRGNNFNEQIQFNFSMTHPEGFRKSLRLMKQAEKFNRPVICFVDTIGAYPGESAESRGQANAIANNIMEMSFLKVPIITVLIGNGCSGGALALCVSDRLLTLENATLSVISAKASEEIFQKNSQKKMEFAQMLKMTSSELLQYGIADHIIFEHIDGCNLSYDAIATSIKNYLIEEIKYLKKNNKKKMIKKRLKKYRNIIIGENFD